MKTKRPRPVFCGIASLGLGGNQIDPLIQETLIFSQVKNYYIYPYPGRGVRLRVYFQCRSPQLNRGITLETGGRILRWYP